MNYFWHQIQLWKFLFLPFKAAHVVFLPYTLDWDWLSTAFNLRWQLKGVRTPTTCTLSTCCRRVYTMRYASELTETELKERNEKEVDLWQVPPRTDFTENLGKNHHAVSGRLMRKYLFVSIHCWSVWLFCLIYNCNVFFIDLHYSVIKLSFNVWRTSLPSNPLSVSAHSPLSQFDMYFLGETWVFGRVQFFYLPRLQLALVMQAWNQQISIGT